MRTSLLKKREPFEKIFTESIVNYLKSNNSQNVELFWNSRERPKNIPVQKWYCNDLLNAIFPENFETKAFDPLRREFSYSLVRWRRPFQQLYVSIASSQFLAKRLSHSHFWITPPVLASESLMIIPGNHRIRILDYQTNKSISILKDGFDKSYFTREIIARRLAEECDLPVPQLGNTELDHEWFEESLITGIPFNRLPDINLEKKVLRLAIASMEPFYQKTIRVESSFEYIEKLCSNLSNSIIQNKLFTNYEKKKIIFVIQEINSFARANELLPEFPSVLSHGDFQPANLLLDKEKIWIIDWEFSDRRSQSYDILTYLLESRFPKNISERLHKFVQSGSSKWFSGAELNQLGKNWHLKQARLQDALVFCLEDLWLHVSENDNRQYFRVEDGLFLLVDELSFWVEMEKSHFE